MDSIKDSIPSELEKLKEEAALDVQEEEDDEEEEEGETRCICGDLDAPDGSGLYIQCEQCAVWQHGFCVGIADGEDSHVEKYWCEKCKPELHHLYTVDSTGAKRSTYKPVQEKRRQNRRNNRSSKSTSLTLDADSSSNDTLPYKQTDTDTASSSSRPRSSRAKKTIKEEEVGDDDNEMEQEEGVEGEAQEGGDARDELPITHDDQTNGEDDRKLQDRKRATFSAREEKQYQWMLEKAIKESRRTSHQGDDDDDDVNDERIGEYELQYQHEETHPEATRSDISALVTDNNQNNTGVEPIVHRNERASELTQDVIPKSVSSLVPSSNITSNAMKIHTAADSIAPTFPGKRNSLSASHSSNSTSEDDTKNRAPARRSQRVSKASKRSTNNNANNRTRNAVSNGKLDIGINKPMKPRLPPQRTSLNEMRRRVSAILEFISRTQWELSGDHSSRDDLVRFVENQKFIEQVDSIFEKYDDSFKLMDDLTRSLLLWEKKYSNGSNVHETE